MAFLKDADERGYVQEIKIPWKLITLDGKPVAAGASMACGSSCSGAKAIGRCIRYADNCKRHDEPGVFLDSAQGVGAGDHRGEREADAAGTGFSQGRTGGGRSAARSGRRFVTNCRRMRE